MAQTADIPPLLNPPRRTWTPAFLFVAVLAFTFVAHVSASVKLPIPRCAFKSLTNLPCAFCGGTRSLRALAQLDFPGALTWNPLVLLLALASGAGFLIWLSLPPGKFEQLLTRVQRWPLLAIVLTAVGLNWLYLLLYLPK